MQSAVETWLGDALDQLAPPLQRLHREGGVLLGTVQVELGTGIARWIGRRIARRFGMSGIEGAQVLQVSIRNTPHALHWRRRFNSARAFESVFRPVGSYPQGYWVEETAAMSLRLKVELDKGSWRWHHVGTRLMGMPVPSWLAPRVVAVKSAVGPEYRFSVDIALPLIGHVLSYAGTLAWVEQGLAEPETRDC
jgi:hypothetical protein